MILSTDDFYSKYEPLPDGWKWCPLGDCVEILDSSRIPINQKERNIRTEGKTIDNLYPYYGATGQVGWIDDYLFDEELVLLGEDGAPFLDSNRPKAYLVQGKCWVNNHAHVLKAKPSLLLNSFLRFYLNIFNYRGFVTGTTRLKLNQAKMREILILLPPLGQQRQILTLLESIFTQIRTAREALGRVHGLVKTFRQSVLAAAFRGELSERNPDDEPAEALLERICAERRRKWEEGLRAKGKDPDKFVYEEPAGPDVANLPGLPEGWVWTSVGELCYVGTGATPLRGTKKYWENGSIPWITSGALNDPYVEKAEEFITEDAVRETNAKTFPPGTLLVAMYGEGRTRGLVSELRINAATNQACAALVFEGDAITCKDFVKLFFEKNYEDIRMLSSGGVQPNLNLSIIRKTTIPLPSEKEQKIIVSRIRSLTDELTNIQNSINIISMQIEELEQAALAKAFRGELP